MNWNDFFLGELGAASALTGLLFVSVSVNQARILSLGRMADRGLEALVMLFMVIVVASLALVPGQPPSWLGVEIGGVCAVTLGALVPVQLNFLKAVDPEHHLASTMMVWLDRLTIAVVGSGGIGLAVMGQEPWLYVVAPGILMVFAAVGVNAWVLLIEINR